MVLFLLYFEYSLNSLIISFGLYCCLSYSVDLIRNAPSLSDSRWSYFGVACSEGQHFGLIAKDLDHIGSNLGSYAYN